MASLSFGLILELKISELDSMDSSTLPHYFSDFNRFPDHQIIVTFADRMATVMPDWTGWDKELRRRWGQQLTQGQITRDQHLAKELQLHGAHYVKGAEGDNSKIQTVWAGPRGDRPIDIAFTGSYAVINKFAE